MIARIGPHDVYVTRKRWRDLEQVALADWSAGDRIGYRIAGIDGKANKLKQEALGRFVAHLNAAYGASPTAFEKEWVPIELDGDEASSEVWDLLHDHFAVFGFGRTLDIRTEPLAPIFEDMRGTVNPLTQPQGSVFAIELAAHRHGMVRSLFKKPPLIRITIDSNRVGYISGKWGDAEVLVGETVLRLTPHGIALHP